MQTRALKHIERIFSNTTYVALGECVIQFSHKTRGPKIRRYRGEDTAKILRLEGILAKIPRRYEDTVKIPWRRYREDTASGRDFGKDTAKIRRYCEDTVDNMHFPFL